MDDPRKDRYDHQKIEAKWQKVWAHTKLDVADIKSAKRPYYNLMMFPYPSAEGLHVGNMYAFTGSDIHGRFKRMQGYSVFEPIGLDGFGIHSENFALKIGRHPMDYAKITEKHFYDQLHRIGAMFDFTRTLETYDPSYYRWTQWLFVQMFKHGLAYRAKARVNFCPSCKTVLADEQVIDEKCERCGNEVEKRALEQWFFRITAYAEKLLGNIPKLKWSEKIKVAQTNWIGKKAGISITYPVVTEDGKQIGEVSCFTTRPDTNFGATFVVLAPEHEFVAFLCHPERSEGSSEQRERKKGALLDSSPAFGGIRMTNLKQKEIRDYVASARQKSDQERIAEGKKKTGVFTGFYCINQLNNTKMPLYISDFVLSGFGTGVVVGVPGHDKRDFQFAKAFDTFDSKSCSVSTLSGVERVELPVKRVVVGKDGDTSPITKEEQVQEGEGMMVNSGFLDGMDSHEASVKMMDYLEKQGWGKRTTTYHLRDWLISRQRYWGPPIPMIYCEACAKEGKSWFTSDEGKKLENRALKVGVENRKSKIEKNSDPSSINHLPPLSSIFYHLSSMAGWYPVPEDQLPVLLPRIEDYKPSSDGIAPLSKHKEFFDTVCPCCGKHAVRETDVSDTFFDSSWYFLRYPSLNHENRFAEVANENLDSSSVAGASSPSVSSLRASEAEQNFVRSPQNSVFLPFDPVITKKWLPVNMYTGGAEHSVLHLLYSRFITMALHDMGHLDFDEPFINFFAHGLVIKDGAKMSKSKGNVVNPDEYIPKYGVDAIRLYLMFMGPFSAGGDFRDTGMEGMSKWVGRVWRVILRSVIARSPALAGRRSDLYDRDCFVPQSGTRNDNGKTSPEVIRLLEKTIAKLTDDMEKRRYNTAVATLMELTNVIVDEGGTLGEEELKKYILLLAPFAPHMSEEAWNRLNGSETYTDPHDSVHCQPWPSYDPRLVEDENATIVVQINGKTRGTLAISQKDAKSQDVVETKVKSEEKFAKYFGGSVKKTIFVPGRLINFVV